MLGYAISPHTPSYSSVGRRSTSLLAFMPYGIILVFKFLTWLACDPKSVFSFALSFDIIQWAVTIHRELFSFFSTQNGPGNHQKWPKIKKKRIFVNLGYVMCCSRFWSEVKGSILDVKLKFYNSDYQIQYGELKSKINAWNEKLQSESTNDRNIVLNFL